MSSVTREERRMARIAKAVDALAGGAESIILNVGNYSVDFTLVESRGDVRYFLGPCPQCDGLGLLEVEWTEGSEPLVPSCCVACESKPVPLLPRPLKAPAPERVRRCKECGKFLSPDFATGLFASRCGDCRETHSITLRLSEQASKLKRQCDDCGVSLEGAPKLKLFCNECGVERQRIRARESNRRRTHTRALNNAA